MITYKYKTVQVLYKDALDDVLNMWGELGWRFVHIQTVSSIPLKRNERGFEEPVPNTPIACVTMELKEET